MNWEEHEKEYGITVKSMPNGIFNQELRIYHVTGNYSNISNYINYLDYEYEGKVSFECVKNQMDDQWYIINKEDLNKLEIV